MEPSILLRLVLLSLGRHMKRWRKRWFVLDGCMLYSFKNEKEYKDPTESIDLRVFSSVRSSEDSTHRPNSFIVYSPELTFSLVASSEAEKEDWIRAIGRAIVVSRATTWNVEDE